MILATLIASNLAITTPKEETPPKKSFTYFSAGVVVAFPQHPRTLYQMREVAPDLFIGHRLFFAARHGIDFGGGGGWVPHYDLPFFYGQASYLYYPKGYDGFYLGGGATLLYGRLLNIPITFGYQFQKERPTFIQFQVTPLMTGTLHYGVAF